MSVITEAGLRLLLKSNDLSSVKEFRAEAGTIVTPSAKSWLSDNKIDLIVGNKHIIKNPTTSDNREAAEIIEHNRETNSTSSSTIKPSTEKSNMEQGEEKSALPHFEKPARYNSLYGGFYDTKPEFMTAIKGNLLVFKDHPRIALRGRIDSFSAQIVKAQVALRSLGMENAVSDLQDVLSYVMEILRAEVLDEPLESMDLFGMTEDEIRAHSHTPKKYYGIQHFSASVDDGEAIALLNGLRTEVREVELIAYSAFKTETGEPTRPDIIQGFNRLSSAIYVMMLKAKSKEYDT